LIGYPHRQATSKGEHDQEASEKIFSNPEEDIISINYERFKIEKKLTARVKKAYVRFRLTSSGMWI
jgi:hypothetical protein